MLLFGSAKRLEKLEEMITQSFSRVKEDTDVLFHWVHYLNGNLEQQRRVLEHFQQVIQTKVAEQERQIEHMGSEKKSVQITADDVRRMVHEQAQPLDAIGSRLQALENALERLETRKTPSNLQERIAKRITRNSKDYIKGVLMSFIQKYERISALKLREIVVEEQGLCSKSSFYRLLEELQDRESLDVIVEGKQKVVVARRQEVQP